MSNIKIFTDNIDGKAMNQVYELAKQKAFADCKIRIMPDVHAGAGCVIGFTADLGEKVIPNIVGVDIGCGMLCCEIGKIDIDYKKLDSVIREYIPSGRNVRSEEIEFSQFEKLHCKDKLRKMDWLKRSMGSLGGGNHFVEVDEDSDGIKYLVIHTGSRNLGKQVAEIYQNMAYKDILEKDNSVKDKRRELIESYKRNDREKEISEALKNLDEKCEIIHTMPKELCYLEGKHREMYLHDMEICQEFARINRRTIQDIIFCYMGWSCTKENDRFHTVHNYIDHKSNIVRKGAISAQKGEKVLIPINMRDGCIIGVGKGNEDWNCSAPHGAGRIMSRSQAKEKVSMEEYKDSMKNIYTTSVNLSTIDESPMVYKPIEEIVEKIKDTVDILKIIKPIYNFKASE